jgi:hypothetical protein
MGETADARRLELAKELVTCRSAVCPRGRPKPYDNKKLTFTRTGLWHLFNHTPRFVFVDVIGYG